MRNFILYIIPVALLLVIFVNFFIGEPKFNSLEEEEIHYLQSEDYEKQEHFYGGLLQKDTFNIYYHFNLVTAHFNRDNEVSQELGKNISIADDSVQIYYRSFLLRSSIIAQDMGHFGLGMYYYKTDQFDSAYANFKQIVNPELPYLNYMFGCVFMQNDSLLASQYFEDEIANDGYLEGAYKGLIELNLDNIDELYRLATNEHSSPYMSVYVKRKVFFNKGDLRAYFKSIFERFLKAFNVYGFGGALLILLVWLNYLVKLDFYQKERWRPIIITLFLAMPFAFLTSYFSDYLKFSWHFTLNGELLHDLFYCVVGIGLVEEMIKIIPFLLVLKWGKVIKEPIDYIIYSSVSALGFAFIENIFYFDLGGLQRIQGRAISAVIIHLFNSSLIAYAMVLGKYIPKYQQWKTFIIGLAVVAVWHGFYDFWLINQTASKFSMITFFQLLIGMFVWSSMINNCMNNSSNFERSEHYDPRTLNDYLLYGLSFVFMFEYIVVSLQYGASSANKILISDALQGSFLLVFLTFSLSKFDIIRHYWAPISFWDWHTLINSHRIHPQYFNLKEIIGQNIEISVFREESLLKETLPVNGVIQSRELISWEKDWYFVKLNKPILIGETQYHQILIKAKEINEIILSKPRQIVNVRGVSNELLLFEKKKTKTDFPFLDYAVIFKC